MYKDLLSHSPLLALPLAALFVFLGVFIIVVLRTLTTRAPSYARVAELPLEEERHEPS